MIVIRANCHVQIHTYRLSLHRDLNLHLFNHLALEALAIQQSEATGSDTRAHHPFLSLLTEGENVRDWSFNKAFLLPNGKQEVKVFMDTDLNRIV